MNESMDEWLCLQCSTCSDPRRVQQNSRLSKELHDKTSFPFRRLLAVEGGLGKGIRGILLLECVPVLRIAASLGRLEAPHQLGLRHGDEEFDVTVRLVSVGSDLALIGAIDNN
jgi:hypothetical protein